MRVNIPRGGHGPFNFWRLRRGRARRRGGGAKSECPCLAAPANGELALGKHPRPGRSRAAGPILGPCRSSDWTTSASSGTTLPLPSRFSPRSACAWKARPQSRTRRPRGWSTTGLAGSRPGAAGGATIAPHLRGGPHTARLGRSPHHPLLVCGHEPAAWRRLSGAAARQGPGRGVESCAPPDRHVGGGPTRPPASAVGANTTASLGELRPVVPDGRTSSRYPA